MIPPHLRATNEPKVTTATTIYQLAIYLKSRIRLTSWKQPCINPIERNDKLWNLKNWFKKAIVNTMRRLGQLTSVEVIRGEDTNVELTLQAFIAWNLEVSTYAWMIRYWSSSSSSSYSRWEHHGYPHWWDLRWNAHSPFPRTRHNIRIFNQAKISGCELKSCHCRVCFGGFPYLRL